MSDEVVSEIHRIRAEYAARFQNDLDKIYCHLKQKERESGRKYVNLVKVAKKRLARSKKPR